MFTASCFGLHRSFFNLILEIGLQLFALPGVPTQEAAAHLCLLGFTSFTLGLRTGPPQCLCCRCLACRVV